MSNKISPRVLAVLLAAIAGSSLLTLLIAYYLRPTLLLPRRVEAIGVVAIRDSIMSSEQADRYLEMVEYALENETIKAVVVYVDSPGGIASAVESIYSALKDLSEEKPVVCYIAGMALSGGYYIAVACDEIFTNPSSMVGSVGVLALAPGLYKPSEAIVETGPYKRTGFSPVEFPFTIAKVLESFLRAVEEGRGERLAINETELALAKIYVGSRAVELGLVDAIGSLRDAIEAAAERAGLKEYEVVYLKPKREVLEVRVEAGSLWNRTLSQLMEYPEPAIFLLYLPSSLKPRLAREELRLKASAGGGARYALVDLSHSNWITVTQVNTLQALLVEYNCTLRYALDWKELEKLLDEAEFLVIPTPWAIYKPEEAELIANYTENGGRVLLLYEPSAGWALFANTIAARLGFAFSEGYLYNLAENFGNYRNIYAYPALNHTLVANVSRALFFTATNIYTLGRKVLVASNGTVLSTSEREGSYVLLACTDSVVALADQTILGEPFALQEDNWALLSNIIEYLLRESP